MSDARRRPCGYMKLPERIQRRWACAFSDMSDMPYYDQRLRHLDLFSVNGSLLRADLIFVWKIFKGQSSLTLGTLFYLLKGTLVVTVSKLSFPKPFIPDLFVRKHLVSELYTSHQSELYIIRWLLCGINCFILIFFYFNAFR